jgi:MbtH protein
MAQDRTNTPTYVAVVNHEGYYSIWRANKPVPLGWYKTDKVGAKEDLLHYIAGVWTDMRPLSLRQQAAPDSKSPD